MAKNTVSNIAFFSGLTLLVYGLYAYFSQQAKLLKNFSYNIIGGSINNISTDNLSVNLNINFVNKSAIEVSVLSFNLNFYMNGIACGTLLPVQPFVIAANSSSTIPITVNIDPSVISGNIIDIVTASSNLNNLLFVVQGTATIRSSFIVAKLPINYQTCYNELMSS